MATWVDYKGLTIPSATASEAGEKLTEDLKQLIDSAPYSNYTASTDPDANDDETQGYYPGARWLNTTNLGMWICVDNTPAAAEWVPLFRWSAAALAVDAPVRVPSLEIADAADDNVISLLTASDEAADRTLTIPPLGGDKTLACVDLSQTFSEPQTFLSDSTDPVKIARIANPATYTAIYQESLNLIIDNSIGNGMVQINGYAGIGCNTINRPFMDSHNGVGLYDGLHLWGANNSHFQWSSHGDYYSPDTSLARGAAQVVRLADASTGGATISSPANSQAQFTANVNNLALSSKSRFQRWSSDASRNVTGIVAGVDGQEHHIYNVGSFDIVLKHQTTSSPANQFFCDTLLSTDITLTPNQHAHVLYDATTARWRASKF